MAFFRWRTIKGRKYLYREERWREDGKVRSRSTLVRPEAQSARKVAREKFHDTLRDNVYRYGKSKSGERYAREAKAREQYHRFLDLERAPSVKEQYDALIARGQARAEWHGIERNAIPSVDVPPDIAERGGPPEGMPTPADETARAEALAYFHDWQGQQQEAYVASTNSAPAGERDFAPDDAGPADGPVPDGPE
jgi:hypothetical protein